MKREKEIVFMVNIEVIKYIYKKTNNVVKMETFSNLINIKF